MAINGELMFPNYATSTVVQCVRGEVSATTKVASATWTWKSIAVPDKDVVNDAMDMIFPSADYFSASPEAVGKLSAAEVRKRLASIGLSASDIYGGSFNRGRAPAAGPAQAHGGGDCVSDFRISKSRRCCSFSLTYPCRRPERSEPGCEPTFAGAGGRGALEDAAEAGMATANRCDQG